MLDDKNFNLYSFMCGFLTCMSLILCYFIINSFQSTEHWPRSQNVYTGRMGQQSSVQRCTGGSEACKTQNANSNVAKSGANTFSRSRSS